MKLKYFLLFAFMFGCFRTATAQQTAKTSDDILKEAYKKASAEKKNVFVIFHASWCVWCHKMDSSMNDKVCQKMFADNYVICHLTVDESKENKMLENPGADALRKIYHGETAGLPFWMILDKNGKFLVDSKMLPAGAAANAERENIGCPAAKEEVAYFTNVLKATSTLKDPQLKIIEERFSKNK